MAVIITPEVTDMPNRVVLKIEIRKV